MRAYTWQLSSQLTSPAHQGNEYGVVGSQELVSISTLSIFPSLLSTWYSMFFFYYSLTESSGSYQCPPAREQVFLLYFRLACCMSFPRHAPLPPPAPEEKNVFDCHKCLTGAHHYSLCACAAGRVASAVDMSSSEDKSYAYSQFLLWGLGEATSTILVFCAPSIPIMLNRCGRASKLKTSTSWPAAQRRRLSEHPQRPWPRSVSNSTNGDDYHHMNEDNATQLDGFRQSYAETGSIYDPYEQHPLERYLGILKTTDIEITTHTETDLPIMGHRQEQPHHPWRGSQTSP